VCVPKYVKVKQIKTKAWTSPEGCNNNNNNNNNLFIYLLTAVGLSPGGSGYHM
jgi:hypothetical protein